MFGKKGSKILKLPPVRNCFTLAMTNKLVVIINSLKVPKIKKICTIRNEISCTKLRLRPEPLTGGVGGVATLPRFPFSLFCLLNWICWIPPPNKIPRYATVLWISKFHYKPFPSFYSKNKAIQSSFLYLFIEDSRTLITKMEWVLMTWGKKNFEKNTYANIRKW